MTITFGQLIGVLMLVVIAAAATVFCVVLIVVESGWKGLLWVTVVVGALITYLAVARHLIRGLLQ